MSGDEYVGFFEDDHPHGMGKMTYAGGDTFEGEWEAGIKNGQATYTFAQGGQYKGGYANNLFHGVGTFSYANGDEYTGSYEQGKRNGLGRFVPADKSYCYEGDFKNNKFKCVSQCLNYLSPFLIPNSNILNTQLNPICSHNSLTFSSFHPYPNPN